LQPGKLCKLLKLSNLSFGFVLAMVDKRGSSVDFPGLGGFPKVREDASMKSAGSLLLAGALIFVLSANAQTPPNLQGSSKTDLNAQTPPAPVIAPLGVGTVFNASLDDTLDTRKTHAGDLVTAEIAEDVTYQRCLVFPKGTKVTGHVVRVTSGGRGKAGSAIFIQFDKAMMKDGQEVMLNAGIQALAVRAIAPMPSDADTSKSLAPHTLPVEDNTAGTATTNDALVVSTIYESRRTSLHAPLASVPAAEGEFTSEGLFSPESKGSFGRPDLKIYTPTSVGSHGTVLLSARKNMHLDNGTHLLLVVQPPPTDESDAAPATSLNLDPQ
jgi:hypothetical protein